MSSQIINSFDNVQLHSDASGLSLKQKRKNSVSFIFLSKLASKGLIFKTSIPQKYLAQIFPDLSFLTNSECELSFYIVTCNSGEIFIVLIRKAGIGESVNIGQIQANVIWADFVKDNLCILERCGKLHIGCIRSVPNFNIEDQIQWKSKSLPLIPVCCLGIESILVLSDGFSSYLYEVGDWVSDHNNEILILPYCGVIYIKKTTSAQVVLTTGDGRKYVKSLTSLKEDSKMVTKNFKSDSFFIKNIKLSSVMKAIKRYSDHTRHEKIKLDDINLYLEQISIAQSFISEPPNSSFTVHLSISCREEDEIFMLSIKLIQIMSQIKLQGPWWQLNVKLIGCDNVSCLYKDLINVNSEDDFHFIKFKVPFSFVEKFVSNLNQEVNIEFDLSFSHFSTSKPLCTFRIHKEPLDILCFLTSVSSNSLPTYLSPSFEIKVNRLFESFRDKTEMKENNVPSHQQVYVLLRQKLKPVLESSFPEIIADKSPSSCTKWFRHDMVKLTRSDVDTNLYKVSIDGTSRPLITAIKFAIEKRAFKYLKSDIITTNNNSAIKLQSEYYKKVLVTKTILDLETSTEFPSDVAVKRILDSLNDLIVSIFI